MGRYGEETLGDYSTLKVYFMNLPETHKNLPNL